MIYKTRDTYLPVANNFMVGRIVRQDMSFGKIPEVVCPRLIWLRCGEHAADLVPSCFCRWQSELNCERGQGAIFAEEQYSSAGIHQTQLLSVDSSHIRQVDVMVIQCKELLLGHSLHTTTKSLSCHFLEKSFFHWNGILSCLHETILSRTKGYNCVHCSTLVSL